MSSLLDHISVKDPNSGESAISGPDRTEAGEDVRPQQHDNHPPLSVTQLGAVIVTIRETMTLSAELLSRCLALAEEGCRAFQVRLLELTTG